MAAKYETDVLAESPGYGAGKGGFVKDSGDGIFALVWKDLRVSVKKGGKVLLHDISGVITSGFYAVMGPSGSGKTTLLNSLAYRLDSAVKVSGAIRMNGRPYSQKELKVMAGYVMQDDLMVATMSVQETMDFAARLRLPATFTAAQRRERVEEGLSAMGIAECRDTYIGNEYRKGVSGGERKRVCVAQELLTRPVLLFLDEPTSGLDSVTALMLCDKLRVLANSKACTVVSTIHQPQAKIFSLFSDLLLLKGGVTMYMGPADRCEDHFTKIGSPLELHENPADHFMDSMASEDVCQKLLEAYQKPDVNLEMCQEHTIVATRQSVSWITQFVTCFGRVAKDQWRNRTMFYLNLFQSCVVGLFIGLTFLKMGQSNASQVKRRNLLFLCALNQGVCGAFLAINTFPPERALMLRERANGMYRGSAYFLAKQFGDLPGQIICPWVFSAICYFMIGLNTNDNSKFFIFGVFMMLTNIGAVSLAIAISSIARTTDFAFTLLPFGFEVARNFCSFFLPPSILPKYYTWLDAMSYLKYSLTAVTINEHWGLMYTDPPVRNNITGRTTGGPFTTGAQAMAAQGGYWTPQGGFDLTIQQCGGWLVFYIIIARFIAYLGIRFVKW